jgi:hypothetical protein
MLDKLSKHNHIQTQGFITSRYWAFWPLFLLPFGVLGFALCRRIWDVKPGRSAH